MNNRILILTRCREIVLSVLFMILLLASALPVLGHNLGQSYVYLRIYENSISGRFEIILEDLNLALNKQPGEPLITLENLAEHQQDIEQYLSEHTRFSVGGTPLPISFTDFDTLKTQKATFVLLQFNLLEGRVRPDILQVDYSVMFDVNPDHIGMVLIQHYWRGGIFNNESQPSLVLSEDRQTQLLDISRYTMFTGFLGVIKLGIKHMLQGIDHLLFLSALILPAAMVRREREWEPAGDFGTALATIIAIVTLYTLGHSLTLSLAAMGIVDLPTRLVETFIALSIAMAALNVLFPLFKKKFALVVFSFGLLQGFGLAGELGYLGVLKEHTAASLVAFSLGVVFFHVAVIVTIFPALYFLRSYIFYPKIILKLGAAVLITMSLVWFVDRAILEVHFNNFLVSSLQRLLS